MEWKADVLDQDQWYQESGSENVNSFKDWGILREKKNQKMHFSPIGKLL
jgi:hypothetical protein